METTKRKYTWKPDLPDHRDFQFSEILKTALPAFTNNRNRVAYINDQGPLGSCTGNSIARKIDDERVKQGLPIIQPSRLLIYYMERAKEGTINQDAGAQIRDGIKCMATQGYAPETLYPYIISKFKRKPPVSVFNAAKQNLVKQYSRLDNSNLTQLKTCLALGYTFVFGFSVYESFESDAVAKTGKVPMPGKTEKLMGGHAVQCVDYDDREQCFIVANSWGSSWGDGGFFHIPYAYATDKNLADDFWNIQLV